MRQTQLNVAALVLIESARLSRSYFKSRSLLNSFRAGAHCDLVTHDVSTLFSGGEHADSPRDEGSDRSGARHQGIGLSVTVVLLILILVSILRTALNIAYRAIAVARARSCGRWLTGTLWDLLLQGVVALVQWTMARRRAISGAAGRVMEDKEDREGSTPAGTRLLIRSSPDRGSVLLHRDQHFIERESYRSGRERTLEFQGRSWYVTLYAGVRCTPDPRPVYT
jgi:hypothetical protein